MTAKEPSSYQLKSRINKVHKAYQARREGGGAEGVIARGPGDTKGPGVQNCQDRMQNYGLRTPLAYLWGCHCAIPPI